LKCCEKFEISLEILKCCEKCEIFLERRENASVLFLQFFTDNFFKNNVVVIKMRSPLSGISGLYVRHPRDLKNYLEVSHRKKTGKFWYG
jgi:hypothetical protein